MTTKTLMAMREMWEGGLKLSEIAASVKAAVGIRHEWRGEDE